MKNEKIIRIIKDLTKGDIIEVTIKGSGGGIPPGISPPYTAVGYFLGSIIDDDGGCITFSTDSNTANLVRFYSRNGRSFPPPYFKDPQWWDERDKIYEKTYTPNIESIINLELIRKCGKTLHHHERFK